jgi:hypothetical protein
MSVAGGHATVSVWQDGGKAGELCVDRTVARQFVESLNRINEPTIKVYVDTKTGETNGVHA